MKVSYNWLKEYVDFDMKPEELADLLTSAGIEVESINTKIPEFSGVVVGKVLNVSPHPNADKLSLCRVTDGLDTVQVICGAPNVQSGQIVPFAKIGARLMGEFEIKKAKIRGVESFGMICSKEELGLEKKSDGIWSMDDPDLRLGTDLFAQLAERQDYILDLFITPNRPDCLSIIGIAREVAALTGKPLRVPQVQLEEVETLRTADHISVRIECPDGCPRYAARLIKGVKIGPSPEWLTRNLEAVGVRSINNIVDITNYVLMELGHPLHAFDLAEIHGNTINVRYSKENEVFTTLDEKERRLPERTVMICDADRAVAIGGIMGGLNSEVSARTTDILLESAYFKRERIALSSKMLGLSTEASQRFERGADPKGVIFAIDRAADLMARLGSGKVASGVVDAYPEKIPQHVIPYQPERVNKLLGTDYSSQEIIQILSRLGFGSADAKITVPSYRVDVTQEVDLSEEIARLAGYDNLPTRDSTDLPYDRHGDITKDRRIGRIRELLIETGLNEIVTNSMLKPQDAALFFDQKPVSIINPVSDDMIVMRPTLLPGLLGSIRHNHNRNQFETRFFEIGRVFYPSGEAKLPEQPYHVAAALTGKRFLPSWQGSAEVVDFYDIKGLLESFLGKIFLDNITFILYDKHEYLEPEEALEVRHNDQPIGFCGRISKTVADHFGIGHPVFVFNLVLESLLEKLAVRRQYAAVARFPFTERDMALVIDESVSASEVIEFVEKTGGTLLKNIEIFDVFKGANVPQGKKSIALRMQFQSYERTLTDTEVDDIFKSIIEQSETHFKASLRK